ncbi:unnamed protein product [Paramecium sonneborni]|uniref:JmjC domain-containing protein n=1 Tax=Paramecium sonneborni TaxID=65129 RepID=A0A8S1PC89_9CILI|nr:unnamed protein product [Paramecium sonneborni]
MNLFAEFVNLHYQVTSQEKELLEQINIENLLQQYDKQENQPKFKEVLDSYLDLYNNTQPQKINDPLERFHLPISEWVDQSVFLWEFPQDVLDQLNRGYFRLQNIKHNHGQESVILTQQLKINQENTEKSSFSMNLSKYIEYISNPIDFFYKNKQYNPNKLLCLFDLSIENWEEESFKLYENLPQSFLKEDGLSYLRTKIQNINQLQLNILSPGSWKGLKQESGAVNLLSLNHGPGNCLWIVIDSENIEKLFQNENQFILQEGNHYLKRELLKKYDIPYKRFIQKPGDLIILGAGSFYQIESLSTTITTGWSFLAMNSYSYQQIIKRQKINIQYQIKSQLPFKNLFLDIFIHHPNEQLKIYLQEFLTQELEAIQEFQDKKKIYSIDINYSIRNYCFCNECKEELFLCCYKYQQKVFCLKCDKIKYYQVQCKYNINILQLILSSQQKINCSYHYCSQSELQNNKCIAKIKQSKNKKPTSPQSIKESSTSNIENVLKQKTYIQEEEKEANEQQLNNKQDLKLNQKSIIVQDQSKNSIQQINFNMSKINKVKFNKKKIQTQIQQIQQIESGVNKNNEIIQVLDEPPNLQTYAIRTRKRQQILETKRNQDFKKKKSISTKPIIKQAKQKQKYTSIYNKTKLSEEEMNEILGLQSQQSQERIFKKGEKMLTL